MHSPQNQADFVSGLQKLAQKLASEDPAFADMQSISEALVAETRTRIAAGQPFVALGACLTTRGDVELIDAELGDIEEAVRAILFRLTSRASDASIRAAAFCRIVDKQVPGGPSLKCIEVFREHVNRERAFVFAIPLEKAAATVPSGVNGPGLGFFSKATKPIVFKRNK